jgi:hypothetical protein
LGAAYLPWPDPMPSRPKVGHVTRAMISSKLQEEVITGIQKTCKRRGRSSSKFVHV